MSLIKLVYNKWFEILPIIDGRTNVYALSVKSQMTHSHCVRIVQEFKELKWIKGEKVGRQKLYTVTAKGEEMLKAVLIIKNALDKHYPKAKKESFY